MTGKHGSDSNMDQEVFQSKALKKTRPRSTSHKPRSRNQELFMNSSDGHEDTPEKVYFNSDIRFVKILYEYARNRNIVYMIFYL